MVVALLNIKKNINNKIMKFYSKYSNHRIVLKAGQPGEPITGRLPQPGIYVKFEHGVADVKDETTIELLRASKDFGTTIIEGDEDNPKADPYSAKRKGLEPEHDVTELEYGHIGKNLNPKPKMAMSEDQKQIVVDMAKEMAKSMAPELAKEMLLSMAAENKAAESKEAPKDVAKPAASKTPATKAKK